MSDVHVLPLHDLREHEESRTCWCQPLVENVSCTDDEHIGRTGALVVHQAADGRELVERYGLQ